MSDYYENFIPQPSTTRTHPPQIDSEHEIERLIAEIGRIIHRATPQSRADLTDFAHTLLHEETAINEFTDMPRNEGMRRPPQNPLAAGLLLTLLGVGLAFLIAPIGLILAAIGLILIVWGGIMSSFRA